MHARTRRQAALMLAPALVIGSIVAWAITPAAQAASAVPVPYRVGYASDDVPVLSAVLPATSGPSPSASSTGAGGVTLPSPDTTRPAEEPGARNGALVFVTHRAGHHDGDLRYRAPGSTAAVPVLDDDFDDRNPQLSPDGRTIAFDSDRAGQPDIWTIGVDGRNLRRITDHPADDTWPTWSPTGDRIAFSSTRDDPKGDIYAVTLATGVVTRLTNDTAAATPFADTEPAWSPTGVIAFTTTRFPGTSVATIAPDGTIARVAAGDQPAWSPDGLRLAYVTRDQDPSGDIAVTTLLTGSTVVAAGNPARAETHPAWDGTTVDYADTAAKDDADVWSADATGQDREDDTQRPGADETAPAYTTDGTRLAYTEAATVDEEGEGASRITVAAADGTDPKPLTAFVSEQHDDDPAWSPDGTMIAFTRHARDGTCTVVIVRVADGAQVGAIPVPFALQADDSKPTWSPDGRRIVFARYSSRTPAGAVTPGRVDRRVNPGGTFTVDQTVKTPALPPRPDISLVVDTTGSMANVIADIRTNLQSTIADVRNAQPDAQFAVAGFKDTTEGPLIYTLFQPMTANADAVQSAVNQLDAAGGDDVPEAWINALVENSGTSTGWRDNSSRIVVLVSDASSHDPSNGHTMADAIAALQGIGARVIAVNVGNVGAGDPNTNGGMDATGQATQVVNATGGQLINSNTSSPGQVSQAILAGLHNLNVTVTPVVKSCDPGVTVTFDPAAKTTVPGGTDVHYRQTATVAAGLAPGTILHCLIAYPISPDSSGDDAAYLAPLTVEVNDPALPLVTADDVTVNSTDLSGDTPVGFTATAVAADGTPLTPTCTPPSGTGFPVGQTIVTCTATDAAGNVGQDTARITVLDTDADAKTHLWAAALTAPAADGSVTVLDQTDLSEHVGESCRAWQDDDDPAYSPDGTAIAFSADGTLCVIGPDGQDARTLVTSPTVEDPAWTPDGSTIGYTSASGGDYTVRSIVTIPAAGGTPATLIDTPGQAWEVAFRPLIAGLALTVTATPVKATVGDPPIVLSYTVTNPTAAPASRVWLSSIAANRAPDAVPIGALAPGASTTVTVDVPTGTPLSGLVNGLVTGLFPGDLPASAIAHTSITIVARPIPPTTTPPTTTPPAVVFKPTLRTDPPIGPPGFVTMAIGTGFPPNTVVTLAWNPGISAPTTVRTSATGTFRTQMLVFNKDQLGQRNLFATGAGFARVGTPFLVVPGNQQPSDFAVRR